MNVIRYTLPFVRYTFLGENYPNKKLSVTTSKSEKDKSP
jgi:hypothetical protein